MNLVKSWEINGTGGRRYVVSLTEGRYTCTCPDFIYRHADFGGECKHIKAIKAENMVAA